MRRDIYAIRKKFAVDGEMTFIASVSTLPLGFVITVGLGRYLGAGDFRLYRMTFYDLRNCDAVAAIVIPAAMIKYVAEY